MVNKIADKFPSKLPEIVKSFRNTNTAGNGFMKSNHVLAPKADNTVHVDIYKHDNVDFVQALKAKYLSNSIAGTGSKASSMPNRKSGVLSRAEWNLPHSAEQHDSPDAARHRDLARTETNPRHLRTILRLLVYYLPAEKPISQKI